MKVIRIVAFFALASLAIAACAGSNSSKPSAASTAPSAPAAAASVSPTAGATAPSTRIEVTLADTMRIEPAAMTVPAGTPITFVVTNTGSIAHEFTLGDEDVQAEHEQEMMNMGGMPMSHDEDNAIFVDPGKTKELVYTFDKPGSSLAGCHVPGHYPAGMRSTITVTDA